MAENPYESSIVRSTSDEDQPRIRISAVLLGLLADIGSTMMAGIVLVIVAAVSMGVQGGDPEAFAEELEAMPLVNYGGFFLGCLGTVLGGYVAALLGKVWPFKHALLMGIGSLLLGVGMTLAFNMDLTSIKSLASMAIVIPMALLGGYIYTLQRGPLPPDPRDVM